MMSGRYQVRENGPARARMESMAQLKLKRLLELNMRLREDLDRPRVKVSEAAMSLVNYCNQTRDYMVPSVWGQIDKHNDPYNPQSKQKGGCCVVM